MGFGHLHIDWHSCGRLRPEYVPTSTTMQDDPLTCISDQYKMTWVNSNTRPMSTVSVLSHIPWPLDGALPCPPRAVLSRAQAAQHARHPQTPDGSPADRRGRSRPWVATRTSPKITHAAFSLRGGGSTHPPTQQSCFARDDCNDYHSPSSCLNSNLQAIFIMIQPAACSPGADAAFGPAVKGCRGDFDFTLTFEQVICSVGASGLLLLFTPLRIAQLLKQSTKTLPHWLLAAKLTQTRASIAAACLTSLDALGLALLTIVEHKRSVRPSQLICIYLFFSTILDLSQVRTLWLQDESEAIAGLFSASVAIKLLLLLLESFGKRSFLQSPYRYFPPEALAGVFSTSIFFWVNQLIVRGYRNIITIEDLFNIDQRLSSGELERTIMKTWAEKRKQRHRALLQTVLSCFVKPILNVIIPRICVIGFRFSQPLLINRAVRLIEAPVLSENRNY
nr:metal resistance protein ycf1 [Quercus suber]